MSATLITAAAAVLVALCGGAGAIGASWISTRATKRATANQLTLDERKVDREDFDAITTNLWKALAETNTKLETAEKARATAELRATEAERRAASAEQRAGQAEDRALQLDRRVGQLEDAMRDAHIPIPPQHA